MVEVSVIIPNYNRSNLIKGVVQSALNQTFSDLEVIIVDDCSTDNSREVLEELNKKYSNCKVFFSPVNRGANYCRNKGVELSEGKYLAFLDSDDYFVKDKIEKQIEIIKLGRYPIVFSEFNFKRKSKPKSNTITLEEVLYSNRLGGFSTILVTKDCFNSVNGLDESLPTCQDWDFYLKVLENNNGYYIKEQLIIYEIQSDSVSKNKEKVFKGLDIIFKKIKKMNKKYNFVSEKKLKSNQEYYLALNYMNFGDYSKVREHLLNSLKLKINKLPLFYYILTFLGSNIFNKIIKIRSKIIKPTLHFKNETKL